MIELVFTSKGNAMINKNINKLRRSLLTAGGTCVLVYNTLFKIIPQIILTILIPW